MPMLTVSFNPDTGVMSVTLTGSEDAELTVTANARTPQEVLDRVSELVNALYPSLLIAMRQIVTDSNALFGLEVLERIHQLRTGTNLVLVDMVDASDVSDDEALLRLADGTP
jgi:hypothetical protein